MWMYIKRIVWKPRAALTVTTHELEWLEPWGKFAELELKCWCWEHKRNTEHLTHIINIHNCLSLSCLLFNLQCMHSSGVQHVLKLNKHGNVDKSLPMNIYFLIAGLENKYFFWKIGTSLSSWVKRLVSSWVDPPPWVQLYENHSCQLWPRTNEHANGRD